MKADSTVTVGFLQSEPSLLLLWGYQPVLEEISLDRPGLELDHRFLGEAAMKRVTCQPFGLALDRNLEGYGTQQGGEEEEKQDDSDAFVHGCPSLLVLLDLCLFSGF